MVPGEMQLKMYRFEILTNPNEELGLSEAVVFKCAFGAANDEAATAFVNQISEVWNNRDPLNSPEGCTFQVKFETFLPGTN